MNSARQLKACSKPLSLGGWFGFLSGCGKASIRFHVIPLMLAFLPACSTPSYTQTFQALDQTLEELQGDYDRGYVIRLPGQPAKNREFSAARISLIKSARRNIRAALGKQDG